MRPLFLVVCFLSLVAISGASASEVCTCTNTSFAWRGCADGASVCDTGGWLECTASPDDSFDIGNGCHVTVAAGDDVLLSEDENAMVTVESGGSLSLAGPLEWRVGPAGLRGVYGSAVSFAGCYRRFAGDGPGCGDALDAAALFKIGQVIPCRDWDCADDAQLVRIAWPDDGTVAPATLAAVDGFLAGLDAARDVLCFWQTSEEGYVGADAGYCYKIAALGTGPDGRFLDFDVRQTWNAQSDQAGYKLARRNVIETTLNGTHLHWTRTLHFVETAAIQSRVDQMGRWLRCGESQRAYLIASVTDDPAGDSVLLADASGIGQDLPDGTRCYIDWGWAAGDVAFVMAPVHVTSSVNQIEKAALDLRGAVDWSAVVTDGLGGVPGRGGVQIRNGPLQRFSHVWITDPLSKDNEAIYFNNLPCDSSVYHLTITGGPPDPEADKNYGLVWLGGRNCTYQLTHYYTRHRGDDNFVTSSTSLDPTGKIVWRWIEAGPSSSPGDSGQFLDFGTGNVVDVDGQDGLCIACTSQDGFGSLIIPSGGGSGLMRNLLWVGVFNSGVTADAHEVDNPNFRLENLGVIGSAIDPDMPTGTGSLAGLDTDWFYVRDIVDTRPFPVRLCNANPYGNFARRLSHGVFADVTLGNTPCELGADAQLDDVYFLDIARSGPSGPQLEVLDTATDVQLHRVTAGFRNPPMGLTRGFTVSPFLTNGALTLDGLLLTGFRGPDLLQAMSIGLPANAANIVWEHPTCFADNDIDDTEASLAAYGVPALSEPTASFVAPPMLRFDLVAHSPETEVGCGSGVAGVKIADWAHRKAKLVPTYLGPRSVGCGEVGVESGMPLLVLAGLRWVRKQRRRS